MKFSLKRLSNFFLAIGVLAILLPTITQASSLSELLKKQADLQEQADQSKKKIEQKKREANTLKGAISNLEEGIEETASRIANTESQIATTNQVITALGGTIGQKQAELEALQNKLRSAYISLYELSQTSTVERLAQSRSLSDVVSQAQYIQAIQTDLQGSIAEVNALKTDLESQKKDKEGQKATLEKLSKDLVGSKKSLDNQKSRKNYLLGVAQTEQGQQEAILKKLEQQKETVGQEIYALRRSGGGRFVDGGTGGYPWANADPNGVNWETLFYYRQCTDYAAWRLEVEFGVPFQNTRPGNGSAWNWPALARDQGYRTSTTPRANALISWDKSAYSPRYGHVAWVDRVNGDGTIDVSEYNFRVRSGFGQRFGIVPGEFGSPTYIYP